MFLPASFRSTQNEETAGRSAACANPGLLGGHFLRVPRNEFQA